MTRLRDHWITWRLFRLKGYGIVEAAVALLAHRICGTPMYWHPKATRERMRKERECR